MSTLENLKKLYADAEKIHISLDEIGDILTSTDDPEEAEFYRTIFNYDLQKGQRRAIAEKRF